MKSLKNLKQAADYHAGRLMMENESRKMRHSHVMAKFSKQLSLLAIAVLMLSLTTFPVFAAEINGDVSASKLISTFVGILLSVFRYVGLVLLVVGIIQFVMAIKRTDAESKSDAIQTVVCAVILISLKTIVNALGFGTFENVDI